MKPEAPCRLADISLALGEDVFDVLPLVSIQALKFVGNGNVFIGVIATDSTYREVQWAPCAPILVA